MREVMNIELIEFAVKYLDINVLNLSKYLGITYYNVKKAIKDNHIERDSNLFLFDKGVRYDLEELSEQFDMPLSLIELGYDLFNHKYNLISFEELTDRIVNHYEKTTDIAKELGCSKQYVANLIKQYGIDKMVTKTDKGVMSLQRKKIEDLQDEIIKLYTQERKRISQISRELQVERNTLTQFLKDKGIFKKTVEKEEFAEIYSKARNLQEVADYLNVHKNTVFRIVKDNGIYEEDYYRKRKKAYNKTGVVSEEVLYDLFIKQNKTFSEIGEELNIGNASAQYYINYYGLNKGLRDFDYILYTALSNEGYSDDEIREEMNHIEKEDMERMKEKFSKKIEQLRYIVEQLENGETREHLSQVTRIGMSKLHAMMAKYNKIVREKGIKGLE